MQMADQNIIAGKHGTNFWNEDSMEFYVNASDDLNAKAFAPKIFQVNINAADIGNTDPAKLTLTGVNSADTPVQGYVFKTDDGWGFEAVLPLEGLVEPAHGKEIGFQAQINGASTADRDVKLIWSKADTTDQSWQIPRLFGRAIFFELGRTDIPIPSPVLAVEKATPTPEPEVKPALVSVNQAGYTPKQRKIASVAVEPENPQEWTLTDSKGNILVQGWTTLFGVDKSSGDYLQIIDFSDFTLPGEGYQIVSNGLKSVPFPIREDIYRNLKTDAAAYFYGNRSGTPIQAIYAGKDWSRPIGHLSDSDVTCYKGKDADGKDWSGCDYTLNVAGGWYDAGDFGKYVVNGGIAAWTLMNLYEQMPEALQDGSLHIPEQSNQVPDILDEARWEMEFLLSMQVPQGQPQAGMVHHKVHDESWAPIPMEPPTEVDNDNANAVVGTGRYLYPPSTAATLNLAATGAQCARVWREIDPAFSAKCLSAAETAWDAALSNPLALAGNTPGQGGGNYQDNNIDDEFYWAAAELFTTTGDEKYLNFVQDPDYFGHVDAFDWGSTAPMGSLTLATVNGKRDLPAEKTEIIKQHILVYADQMLAAQASEGYSPLIQGAYPWGSNGTILNNMMLLANAYDLSGNTKYLDAVRASMDYLLGRNPMDQSYISGYGTYTMQHPHHRFWANDPANGYPPPPPGAVSGGPNSNPTDPVAENAGVMALGQSKRYVDDIGSFSTNEVAINWNAPLVWVAAFLDKNR